MNRSTAIKHLVEMGEVASQNLSLHEESPEDHLWRAATAVREIEQALPE